MSNRFLPCFRPDLIVPPKILPVFACVAYRFEDTKRCEAKYARYIAVRMQARLIEESAELTLGFLWERALGDNNMIELNCFAITLP